MASSSNNKKNINKKETKKDSKTKKRSPGRPTLDPRIAKTTINSFRLTPLEQHCLDMYCFRYDQDRTEAIRFGLELIGALPMYTKAEA